MMTNYYEGNNQLYRADERFGFGRPGFGFGRPFGFGFGRPGFGFGFGRPFGFGFGFPFLTGLAAGALLAPRPLFYPYPPYPFVPYYW